MNLKYRLQINDKSYGYRLPTREEWFFAARGGNKNNKGYVYAGDFVGAQLTSNNSWIGPSLAKSKKPNVLSLYDMSGNVSEWACSDVSHTKVYYYRLGGDWGGSSREYNLNDLYYYGEPASCNGFEPHCGSRYIGFRVVRSVK